MIQMLESLEIQPSPENEAKIKLLKSYLHGGSSCTLESLSLPSDANSFASTPQRFYGDSSLELNPTSSLRKSAVELFDKLSDHHAHQSLGNKKKPPPPPPLKSVKSSLSVISLKDIEPLEA